MMEGFREVTYPGQQVFDGKPFLLMFSPDSGYVKGKPVKDLVDLVAKHRASLRNKILECGGLVFRGWNLENGKDFAAVVDAFGFRDIPYIQGEAERNHVHGKAFAASATPPDHELPFHSEMAYLAPHYPDVIMLFCETPSPEGGGGGTAFARGDVALNKIKQRLPAFFEKLHKDGVVYSYIPQKGWQVVFDTTDKATAEQRAKEMNAWIDWDCIDGVKVHRGPFGATLKHPLKDDTTSWFNSMGIVFKKGHSLSYGDGTIVDPQDIQAALEIMKEDQVIMEWRKGDLVVADNLGVMHARMRGKPPRNILVSISKFDI